MADRVFRCWIPECDETEDSDFASIIRADYAGQAAIECCSEVWHGAPTLDTDEMEIHVRDDAGELTVWSVQVKVRPQFHARLLGETP